MLWPERDLLEKGCSGLSPCAVVKIVVRDKVLGWRMNVCKVLERPQVCEWAELCGRRNEYFLVPFS